MNREECMVPTNPLRDTRAESMAAGNSWHSDVYARSDKVIRRDVGGETVLVPVAATGAADLEYLYRMNAVGAAVWDLLDGRRTITEIAGQIRASFDISRQDPGQIRASFDTSRQGSAEDPADKVEEDVRAFLADLEEAKLVSRYL